MKFTDYLNEEIIAEGIFGAAMDIFTFKGKIQKLAKEANKDLADIGITKITKIEGEDKQLDALKVVLKRYEQLLFDTGSVIDGMRIDNDLKISFKETFMTSIVTALEEQLLTMDLPKSLKLELKKFTDGAKKQGI